MKLARSFLQQQVHIEIDRPLGSRHPEYGFIYPVNYGYVPGTLAADKEPLEAYLLGVFDPLYAFIGMCIAFIHRFDDDDDKLIVVPRGRTYTDAQIEALTEFQERYGRSCIVRD